MNKASTSAGYARQRGATLIVSLVILAVITVLGLASIRSSNLELRMAASARDRSIAFHAAETALLEVERLLKQSTATYGAANFTASCTTDCFKSDCTGGLCFTGDFVNASTYSDCSIAKTDKTIEHAWQKKAIWNDSSKYRTVNVASSDGGDPNAVKYIIEFLCYTPIDTSVDSPTDPTETGWVPLFRVTTNAVGEAGRASVMLQSVIQAANN